MTLIAFKFLPNVKFTIVDLSPAWYVGSMNDISKFEWFAGMALQGILANRSIVAESAYVFPSCGQSYEAGAAIDKERKETHAELALMACEIAEQMFCILTDLDWPESQPYSTKQSE